MVTPPRILKIRDTRMFVATEATSVIHDIPYYEKKELALHSRHMFLQWMDNP